MKINQYPNSPLCERLIALPLDQSQRWNTLFEYPFYDNIITLLITPNTKEQTNKHKTFFNYYTYVRSLFVSGQLQDLPRRSRSRVTTQAQDNRIRTQHLRDRPLPATRTAAQTIGLHGRPISSKTVIRRLRERGIRARRPYVGPVLTLRHRQARLQWCQNHRQWQARQWNGVLFSDESRFTLEKADGRTRVYRRTGERFTDACVTQVDRFRRGSVMVWGGISHAGKTALVIVRGNLNAQKYRDDILAPVVIPYLNAQPVPMTFQQDNARPHTARIKTGFLQANNVNVMAWP